MSNIFKEKKKKKKINITAKSLYKRERIISSKRIKTENEQVKLF